MAIPSWLITGGMSLISGLFSRSSEKRRDKENAAAAAAANKRNEDRVTTMNADVRARAEQAAATPIVTTNQTHTAGGVDVLAMMKGAEDAGFNPITWLRNGGMQAYAYSNTDNRQTVYNSQNMDAALAGSTIFQEGMPPLSTARGVGEVIGSALSSGASQWVADASQERQNQFQLDVVNAQLEGANRNGNVSGRTGYVPTAYLTGGRTTSGNSAALGIWEFRVDNDPKSPTYGQRVMVPESSMPDVGQGFYSGFGRRDASGDAHDPYDPFKGIVSGGNNPWMLPSSAPSAPSRRVIHPPKGTVTTSGELPWWMQW